MSDSTLSGLKTTVPTWKKVLASALIAGPAMAGGAFGDQIPLDNTSTLIKRTIGASTAAAAGAALVGLISKGDTKAAGLDPFIKLLIQAASRPYEDLNISDPILADTIGKNKCRLDDLLTILNSENFADKVSKKEISQKTFKSIEETMRAVLAISASTGNFYAMREILDRSNLRPRSEIREISENGTYWDIPQNVLTAAFNRLTTHQTPVLKLALNFMAISSAKYELEYGDKSSVEIKEAVKLIFSSEACNEIRSDFAIRKTDETGGCTAIDFSRPVEETEIPSDPEVLKQILDRGEEILIKGRVNGSTRTIVKTIGNDPDNGKYFNRIYGTHRSIADLKLPSLINEDKEYTYQADLEGVISCYQYLANMFTQLTDRGADLSIASFAAVRKKMKQKATFLNVNTH